MPGSLVNQSLQNIEILVINDGSKDNSGEIIKSFEESIPIK
jgi:glycosyltransferase involved in cell wall biosynthesis